MDHKETEKSPQNGEGKNKKDVTHVEDSVSSPKQAKPQTPQADFAVKLKEASK